MKRMEKAPSKIKVHKMYWIYIVGIVVIIGGVMAFGLIGSLFFNFDRDSSLTMIIMVPLMIMVYAFAMRLVLRGIQERMERLENAIHSVAEGNLDTQIDLRHSQEYGQIYKEFNAMAKELSATRKEMESFTKEFAHEFKTPITSINGFAEYLLESGDNVGEAERKEYLQVIADQSKRLLNLSQNTLLLSKMEAMQVVTDKEKYDISEQIRRCVILFSKDAEKKEIEFDLSGIPEDEKLYFYGNREMLEHVFINLISNALKFTDKGGVIKIGGKKVAEYSREKIVITVTDNGIGMDSDTASRIFEKYYQNDTKSLTKGSGIGLSIVKRIIDLCEGTISVSSWPGTGTTFTVTLPAQE